MPVVSKIGIPEAFPDSKTMPGYDRNKGLLLLLLDKQNGILTTKVGMKHKTG